MLKHVILVVVLSTLVVLFPSYAEQGVQWLLTAHTWVSELLTNLFTEGQAGNIARGLIGLLAISVAVALIPSIIYWVVRKHWFPYFMQVVWVVWLVQFGALMVAAKVVSGG